MNELDKIIAHKRQEVAGRKNPAEIARLEKKIEKLPAPRDFAGAISGKGMALIAEVKKASPSAGLIRNPFDPVPIAQAYEKAGAAALSVLTDEKFFQGRLANLASIREAVRLPCLQKDFVIDDLQLLEARSAGADAVLLIVAALDDPQLKRLFGLARLLDLHTLVEAHDENELLRALELGAQLIGINNRDLTRMEVSLDTTVRLVSKIPAGRTIVSESGIKTAKDVQMLAGLGVNAVLVGETLLKQQDLEAAVRILMGGTRIPT